VIMVGGAILHFFLMILDMNHLVQQSHKKFVAFKIRKIRTQNYTRFHKPSHGNLFLRLNTELRGLQFT
jgi:uncharacterized membrane protein